MTKTDTVTVLTNDIISAIVRSFYRKAFVDPLIQHFFFNKDHDHLIEQQTAFTIALLGGARNYRGRPLAPLHHALPIKDTHFKRRRILMQETMQEFSLSSELQTIWLAKEDALRPHIISGLAASCDLKPPF